MTQSTISVGLHRAANGNAPARPVADALIALAATMAFYVGQEVVSRALGHPVLFLPGMAAALLFAIAGFRVTYAGFGAVFRRLTRFSVIGIFVYLAVEPPDFTLARPEAAGIAAQIEWVYWLALLAVLVSVWRPSFAVLPALYIIATRNLVETISGYSLSILDIRYMVEMAMFLGVAACGLTLAARWRGRPDLGQPDTLELSLAFIAIGFHFGNYFWSGVAKLALGPEPWTWIVENKTNNIIPLALERGVLPVGHWPTVTQMMHDAFAVGVPVSNTLVLVTQAFAVVAILRLSWTKIASLAYDALHLGIWIAGGLFFWPWIWNNASVMAALTGQSDQRIGWTPKLCCIAVILIGAIQPLGHFARLAWWDITGVKHVQVQAQAEGGDEWIDVPVAFFNSHSYAISHGYQDIDREPGHYDWTIWGSSHDYSRNPAPGECLLPPDSPRDAQDDEARQRRANRFERFMRAHHRVMLSRVDENGWTNFYLRSHHHPSNPWLHTDFNALDLRQIRRYRLLTQSVCLSMEEGRAVGQVHHQTEHVVDVGE